MTQRVDSFRRLRRAAANRVAICLAFSLALAGLVAAPALAQEGKPEADPKLVALVRRNLAAAEPTAPLMLSDQAASLLLEQLGQRPPSVDDHVRLLRWLGDPQAIPVVRKLLDEPEADRYALIRTLIALNDPKAEPLALEMLLDQPKFGAPLVACLGSAAVNERALELLRTDDPQMVRSAAWVLGSSRDLGVLGPLETKLADVGPRYRGLLGDMSIAVRRLRLEQRDIRAEALTEYLADIEQGDEEERFWVLAQLAQTGDSQFVRRLRREPWSSRAKEPGCEAALILWARAVCGDKLSSTEQRHLRTQRYHLDWIPGGTHWPPIRQRVGG